MGKGRDGHGEEVRGACQLCQHVFLCFALTLEGACSNSRHSSSPSSITIIEIIIIIIFIIITIAPLLPPADNNSSVRIVDILPDVESQETLECIKHSTQASTIRVSFISEILAWSLLDKQAPSARTIKVSYEYGVRTDGPYPCKVTTTSPAVVNPALKGRLLKPKTTLFMLI